MDAITELMAEHYQVLFGGLVAVILAVAGKAVTSATRWVFSDGATYDQKILCGTLLKRIADISRDWRFVSSPETCDHELIESDEEGVMVAHVKPWTGEVILSGERVDVLLTNRQRRHIMKAAQQRLQSIRQAQREAMIADAIAQARRP
jgi:hypothetical protein